MRLVNIRQIILISGDILLFCIALYSTMSLRQFSCIDARSFVAHITAFTIPTLFFLTSFYIAGLYKLNYGADKIKFTTGASNSIVSGIIFSIVFFYLVPSGNITPKTTLLIFISIFSIIFFIWRWFFNRVIIRAPRRPAAIIGWNEQAELIFQEIENKMHIGHKIAFIANAVGEYIPSLTPKVEIVSDAKQIKEAAIKHGVETIILTSDLNKTPLLRATLFGCLPLGAQFVSAIDFYEQITGKIPVKAIDSIWFFQNLNRSSRKFFNFFKRSYDIILSFFGIALTLLLWPIIAVIIKTESEGPVFFTQKRLGKNSEVFTLIKFRTMTVSNNNQSPTTVNDTRITRFGGFLRASRLDEFPQLINVLKGEMSLVGPRPERPEIVEELKKQIPFYAERTLVKPGITGWDQISGQYHSPSLQDSLEKLQYDLFYIKNQSIYLEISIILKTIATVLGRGGR